MFAEKNNASDRVGEVLGFVFSYIIFTLILYLLLHFTSRLPCGWSYLPVAGITFGIVVFGLLLQRLLR